ncbi:hypothetical protein Tco_1257415 [Tanacetum coccineum]
MHPASDEGIKKVIVILPNYLHSYATPYLMEDGIRRRVVGDTYPGRHVARDKYPQRHVARESVEMSLGIVSKLEEGVLDCTK